MQPSNMAAEPDRLFGKAFYEDSHITASATGVKAAGFGDVGKGPGVDIKTLWTAVGETTPFPIQWVFAGSIVPGAGNSVSRLLFSFTLSGSFQPENPTGCVMALSPLTGALLDSYCIPRDLSGAFGVDNFLATAPIVALDARGTGAHTAIVAQFDLIIFAFDPNNLQQGPIYVANPLKAGAADSVATDFLSMTQGGTLIVPAWDDTDKTWSVFAVPGVLKIAPTNGGGAVASTGLSTGQKAGIAFGVIFAVAGVAAFWYFGGVAKVSAAFSGMSGGGYSSVGRPAFSSSYSKATPATASAYSSIAGRA
jgi:hypothetical protein